MGSWCAWVSRKWGGINILNWFISHVGVEVNLRKTPPRKSVRKLHFSIQKRKFYIFNMVSVAKGLDDVKGLSTDVFLFIFKSLFKKNFHFYKQIQNKLLFI